jgi:hypothetical protein
MTTALFLVNRRWQTRRGSLKKKRELQAQVAMGREKIGGENGIFGGEN